ncbi:MAG: lysylphosphatidylglycerol synthase transmembrane domain-containing protein [Bacteroidales bacterium]|nr:lysylphosphatidylglycerol synthase transmembrane domain-containing protein [Bacteroidales bacterium]
MSDKGKKFIQLFIFLALGIFFIWISIKDLSAEEKASIINNIKGVAIDNRWIFLVFSAAIGFISVIFRAFRSIQLLEPLGYNVSKINSYHSVMICYIANIAFPRLGEVLRCTFIQRYEKVPFQKTFGTVVTERIIDMLSFGLIFLFALLLESEKLLSLFQHKTQSTETTSFLNNPMFILAIILLLVIIILFIFRKSIVKWKLYHKIKQIILGFWSGLLSVVKLKKPLLFVFYTFMIWVCYFFMFYVAIFAFPELIATGNQLWMASLSCVVIGTIGFIISQGGLGAYPLLISSVLLLYGISKELGLAVGWVVWTTETLLYVVGGIISLIIAPFTNPKKNKKDEPLGTNQA